MWDFTQSDIHKVVYNFCDFNLLNIRFPEILHQSLESTWNQISLQIQIVKVKHVEFFKTNTCPADFNRAGGYFCMLGKHVIGDF
jgi:hypothetical protein